MLQQKTFSEIEAVQIVYQTLLALKFLHDQNIVHRDIKSDNILLLKDESGTGRVVCKICDFGLSSYIDLASGGLNGFAGTPEYMPPEVIQQPGNKAFQRPDPKKVPKITQKADIFAIGVLTYELLTGHTAFHFACKSSLRLYNAILNKEPLFNEEIWKRVSSDCVDFIQKCLTKDQTARPSVNELFKHPWFA